MDIKLQKRLNKFLVPGLSLAVVVATIGLAILASANSPQVRTVLIASRDLAEGQIVELADVKSVKIPLGAIASNYLSELRPNLVLSRSIAKDELIPKLQAKLENIRQIPIRLNGLRPITTAITVGDNVDIWATEKTNLSASAPEPVAFGAIVTAIDVSNALAQNSTNIEIRISEEYLESLLNAMDSGYQLSVILNESLADIQ